MRLCEDTKEDVVAIFQELIDQFKELKNIAFDLRTLCNQEDISNIDNLKDFIDNELGTQMHDAANSILDKYYPEYEGGDNEDSIESGRKYRDSIREREQVFKW